MEAGTQQITEPENCKRLIMPHSIYGHQTLAVFKFKSKASREIQP